MAITLTNDLPGEAYGSFERPLFVGEITTGGFRNESDFGDCFMQVLIGSHPDGYVIKSGDYLQLDIRAAFSAAGTFRFGLDMKMVAGPWLSDLPTLDVNGLDVAAGDRSAYEDSWYHIQASLEPLVGYAVDRIAAYSEEDAAGSYRFDLREIVITNGASVDKVFFDGLETGLPTEAVGLYVSGLGFSHTLALLLDDPGPNYGIRFVTSGSSDSIQPEDITVVCSSSSNMTFNLPNATTLPVGKVYFFKQMVAHNLVIDPFSTQLIDGSSTLTLTQYQTVEVINLGSGWAAI